MSPPGTITDKPGHDARGCHLLPYCRLGLWVPARASLGRDDEDHPARPVPSLSKHAT